MDNCCHGSITVGYGMLMALLGYGSVLLGGIVMLVRPKSS
jgi:hypothetical protein